MWCVEYTRARNPNKLITWDMLPTRRAAQAIAVVLHCDYEFHIVRIYKRGR